METTQQASRGCQARGGRQRLHAAALPEYAVPRTVHDLVIVEGPVPGVGEDSLPMQDERHHTEGEEVARAQQTGLGDCVAPVQAVPGAI